MARSDLEAITGVTLEHCYR